MERTHLVVLLFKLLHCSSILIVVSHTEKLCIKTSLSILSSLVCFLEALLIFFGGFKYLLVCLTGLFLAELTFKLLAF